MRVLLTNNSLMPRAGSELYVYDVAVELLARGHQPVAFSPHLGDVAEALRAATVPVVDDLSRISAPPDVIHGHHHYDTLIAVLHFPDTPAINFCHGWAPFEEEPLIHPSVRRYVAVDQLCRERLEVEHGIDRAAVRLILNFVDTSRFRPRPPLPAKPRRALLFDNSFSPESSAALREACTETGIELDHCGILAGQVSSAPEKLLGQYDIVFAKARAALEAMAVGCAVILCGPRGLGPMVTLRDFDGLRPLNFGVRTLTRPLDKEAVRSELKRFNPGEAAAVSARVQAEAGLETAVDRLVDLYEEVIAEARHTRIRPDEAQRAAARYLLRHAATYKGRALAFAQHESRFQEALAKVATLESSRAELLRLGYEYSELRRISAQDAARCSKLERQLGERTKELQALRNSATWRIARAVLENPLMRGLSPLVDRIGRSMRR